MKTRHEAILMAALAFTLGVGGAPHVAAQRANVEQRAGVTLRTMRDSQFERHTRELSAELRCPVCQGISIQDSPAALAKDMRAIVRERLQAGETPEQVKAYFVGRYGEWILLRPVAHGFNWIIYLLPFAMLAGGGVALGMVIRSWRRSSASLSPRPLPDTTLP